jgi:hypothetical protein
MTEGPRRRSRVKVAAMAAVPVVAGPGMVALAATPAAAAVTETRQHTWTDANGINHTCNIQVVREFPYNGDPQVGRGATAALASGDPYCNAPGVIAYIGADFFDPDGGYTFLTPNSDGASTARRYAPVGSAFRTYHDVDYSGVGPGCQSNCVAHFERTK